jgi:hypothetical protein
MDQVVNNFTGCVELSPAETRPASGRVSAQGPHTLPVQGFNVFQVLSLLPHPEVRGDLKYILEPASCQNFIKKKTGDAPLFFAIKATSA